MQLKEIGVIVMLPLPVDRLPGVTITVLSLVLYAINEVRMFSAHFKLQQVEANFGRRLAISLLNDEGHHVQIGGHQIHWRAVQRHFGNQAASRHPEVFEPHLQAEDLAWHKVEATLYRLEPALKFWHDMDYVAKSTADGRPISFNLIDNALNYVNQLPFGQRMYAHAKNALWNELYGRYLMQPVIESHVLKQFDNNVLESESLMLSMHRVGAR